MKLLKIKLTTDKKVVQETLNRIGISNKKEKVLYPSCYIYEDDDGECYLVHFKQLFSLSRDSAYDNISEQDIVRRNSIAFCLKNWGLIDVEDKFIYPHNNYVFVLPYEDKDSWTITHKINLYTLRNKHNIDI
jgi:hypothetical protein